MEDILGLGFVDEFVGISGDGVTGAGVTVNGTESDAFGFFGEFSNFDVEAFLLRRPITANATQVTAIHVVSLIGVRF
jgi:hypothetical protein